MCNNIYYDDFYDFNDFMETMSTTLDSLYLYWYTTIA